MIRVLVVDDHEVVCRGLTALLAATGDLVCVGTAENGEEALAAVERQAPDVVLLDLSMPRVTGLQAARALLAEHPETRIVVLTGSITPALVEEARDLGVVGYLLKDDDPGALPGHVRAVAAGGTAWSDAAASAVPRKSEPGRDRSN